MVSSDSGVGRLDFVNARTILSETATSCRKYLARSLSRAFKSAFSVAPQYRTAHIEPYSPAVAPLCISPLPQIDDNSKWTVIRHCNWVFCTRNKFSNSDEYYFVQMHIFKANTIHNCMQLKLTDLLTNIRNLSNEMTMCRICISNIRCSSCEIVDDLQYTNYVARLVRIFILNASEIIC